MLGSRFDTHEFRLIEGADMKRKWIFRSALLVCLFGLAGIAINGCETGQQVIDTTVKRVSVADHSGNEQPNLLPVKGGGELPGMP